MEQQVERLKEQMKDMDFVKLMRFAQTIPYSMLSSNALANTAMELEVSKNMHLDMMNNIHANNGIEALLGNTGNDAVDTVMEASCKNMLVQREETLKLSVYILKQAKLHDTLVSVALQSAYNTAKTTKEFEIVAKAIEIQLDDTKWATKIRKEIYGEDFIPKQEPIENTQQDSLDALISLIEAKEPEMIEYFNGKTPPGYGVYTDSLED